MLTSGLHGNDRGLLSRPKPQRPLEAAEESARPCVFCMRVSPERGRARARHNEANPGPEETRLVVGVCVGHAWELHGAGWKLASEKDIQELLVARGEGRGNCRRNSSAYSELDLFANSCIGLCPQRKSEVSSQIRFSLMPSRYKPIIAVYQSFGTGFSCVGKSIQLQKIAYRNTVSNDVCACVCVGAMVVTGAADYFFPKGVTLGSKVGPLLHHTAAKYQYPPLSYCIVVYSWTFCLFTGK